MLAGERLGNLDGMPVVVFLVFLLGALTGMFLGILPGLSVGILIGTLDGRLVVFLLGMGLLLPVGKTMGLSVG